MIGGPSLEALERAIDEEVRVRTSSLSNGVAKSYEQYREQVGYITGMNRVKGIISELRAPEKKPNATDEYRTGVVQ